MIEAERAALDQRARKAPECQDRGRLARQVELMLRMAYCLGRILRGQPQSDQADRQVDEEDRAPAHQRNQSAADKGTCGQSEARARGPNADRAAASLFVRIS